MDVLHISDRHDARRDAEILRDRWIARLAASGHRVRHITISQHETRREPGLRVVRRDGEGGEQVRDPRLLVELEELIAEGARPDLVHVHALGGLPNELWSHLARRGIPVVHTAYDYELPCPTAAMHWGDGTACSGGPGEKCFFHECDVSVRFDERDVLRARWRLRAVRGLFRRTITPSRPLAARLVATGLADVHVVPHAGHLARADAPRTAIPPAPTLLYLDALDDAHGLTVMIESFVALVNHHGGAQLTICGDGEHLDWYRHLVMERGLGQRVRFVPRPTDDDALARVLDESDVLVVPSLVAQAMPRSVIEASRRALPIVATRVGALEALLGPKGALLVRPRDPAALSAHVLRLLGDPARYAAMSRALWDEPIGLDADAHDAAVLALYEEALHAPARPVTDAPDAEDLDLVARMHARIAELEITTRDLEERRRASAAESQWLESVLRRIASGRLSRKICQWRGIRAIDEFPGIDAKPQA